jgi:hypothetical protein
VRYDLHVRVGVRCGDRTAIGHTSSAEGGTIMSRPHVIRVEWPAPQRLRGSAGDAPELLRCYHEMPDWLESVLARSMRL